MSRSRIASGLAIATTTGSALALPATAAAPVVQSVTLQGQPVVGATLTAEAVTTDPAVALEYRWQRCKPVPADDCKRIGGAPLVPSYTVAAADVGNRLAVRVVAAPGDASRSALTDIVTTPPPPTPTPTPSPEPTPTPAPTPTATPAPDPKPDPDAEDRRAAPPTFNQGGGPPPAMPTVPAVTADEALPYLRPFPVVRVKGTLVPGGARISLLRIRAPSTATVDVRCDGPECRLRRRSFGSGRVTALERFVRAGSRVTIRVSKAGHMGKYVRLVIRDGSAPKRRDACLLPGDARPAPCPLA